LRDDESDNNGDSWDAKRAKKNNESGRRDSWDTANFEESRYKGNPLKEEESSSSLSPRRLNPKSVKKSKVGSPNEDSTVGSSQLVNTFSTSVDTFVPEKSETDNNRRGLSFSKKQNLNTTRTSSEPSESFIRKPPREPITSFYNLSQIAKNERLESSEIKTNLDPVVDSDEETDPGDNMVPLDSVSNYPYFFPASIEDESIIDVNDKPLKISTIIQKKSTSAVNLEKSNIVEFSDDMSVTPENTIPFTPLAPPSIDSNSSTPQKTSNLRKTINLENTSGNAATYKVPLKFAKILDKLHELTLSREDTTSMQPYVGLNESSAESIVQSKSPPKPTDSARTSRIHSKTNKDDISNSFIEPPFVDYSLNARSKSEHLRGSYRGRSRSDDEETLLLPILANDDSQRSIKQKNDNIFFYLISVCCFCFK
jgi:hypothetical protein